MSHFGKSISEIVREKNKLTEVSNKRRENALDRQDETPLTSGLLSDPLKNNPGLFTKTEGQQEIEDRDDEATPPSELNGCNVILGRNDVNFRHRCMDGGPRPRV